MNHPWCRLALPPQPSLHPGATPMGEWSALAGDLGDPIYVYAIMEAGALALPASGIDPERPVTALVVGNVQAVVSVVRNELFNEQAVRIGLENSNWLAAHVLAHQQVLDALVATKLPVVPMRFCTIYPDIVELCDSLRRYNAAFAAELAAAARQTGVGRQTDRRYPCAADPPSHRDSRRWRPWRRTARSSGCASR